MKKINLILLILLTFFFCACSPEMRLRRLLTRYPHLLQSDTTVISDTKIVSDTVYLPEISLTETLPILHLDTQILEKERLSIQFVHDTVLKKVWIDGKCMADTIIKVDTITFDKVVYVDNKLQTKDANKLNWFAGVVLGVLFLVVIVLYLILKVFDLLK